MVEKWLLEREGGTKTKGFFCFVCVVVVVVSCCCLFVCLLEARRRWWWRKDGWAVLGNYENGGQTIKLKKWIFTYHNFGGFWIPNSSIFQCPLLARWHGGNSVQFGGNFPRLLYYRSTVSMRRRRKKWKRSILFKESVVVEAHNSNTVKQEIIYFCTNSSSALVYFLISN